MAEFEHRGVEPDDFADELENAVRRMKEGKYTFQVGLIDVDFDVDQARAEELGVTLPFQNIERAEMALWDGVITPTEFLEVDETLHQVAVFDHVLVGFSGFEDRVTHSLASLHGYAGCCAESCWRLSPLFPESPYQTE